MHSAPTPRAPRVPIPSVRGSSGPLRVVPERIFTLDLAAGGCRYYRLADAEPLAEVYSLTIPLPGSALEIDAIVSCLRRRRVGPLDEVAVEFRYLNPEDRRILEAYLAARAG